MNACTSDSLFLVVKCSLFEFWSTDDVIDETYGVAVQFDEEEEEVCTLI